MSSLRGAAEILKTAKRLLLSDEIGGSAIARSGCIEKAIPILVPNHKRYAWSTEIESPDGSYRKLYIAGEIVWEPVSTSISSSYPNGIY